MDKGLVSKFRIIIGDKRHDLKENCIIGKKHRLRAIIPEECTNTTKKRGTQKR